MLAKRECIQLNQSVFSLANAYRSRMVREGTVERTGLSLADRSTLMVIGQSEPTTARDLSKRMDINPGTISVYVQQLVEHGLVGRARDKNDRRTWWLRLTEKGTSAYQETLQGTAAYTRDFLSPLSDEEQQTLHQLLVRVVRGLGYEW